MKNKINDFLTREELLLPENLVKTNQELGKKYGFSENTIRKYRKSHGVKRIEATTLTEEQKEILWGIVMGKGKLNENGSVELIHSVRNFAYISWLAYKLKNIIPRGLEELRNNKFRIVTIPLDFFGRFPKESASFSALSLAVWYAEDGKIKNSLCSLSLKHFDRHAMSEYLELKWGIKTTFHNKDKSLRMNLQNSILFAKVIKYHLIPSMLHKIPRSERKSVVYLAGGMQYSPDGGVKWRRNLKQLLNKKGYYCIDPTKEENSLHMAKNWQDLLTTDFPKFQVEMQKIINNDLYFVKMSSIVVCLYDDFTGGGSFHEIGESYLTHKKLYLLNTDNKPIKKLSWWALGCCTRVFKSYEELLNELPDLSEEPHVPYKINKPSPQKSP